MVPPAHCHMPGLQECYQPVTDLFRALHSPHAQVAGASGWLQLQQAREVALSNLLQVCAC